MTPKQLRDRIEEICDGLIGTYTYPNGYVGKSIIVGFPENDVKVDGIEIILPDFPDFKSNLPGDEVFREECWTVTILQRGDNASLYEVINRLTRAFPVTSAVYFPIQDRNKTVKGARVKIKTWCFEESI